MHDIRAIRDDPEGFDAALARRGIERALGRGGHTGVRVRVAIDAARREGADRPSTPTRGPDLGSRRDAAALTSKAVGEAKAQSKVKELSRGAGACEEARRRGAIYRDSAPRRSIAKDMGSASQGLATALRRGVAPGSCSRLPNAPRRRRARGPRRERPTSRSAAGASLPSSASPRASTSTCPLRAGSTSGPRPRCPARASSCCAARWRGSTARSHNS